MWLDLMWKYKYNFQYRTEMYYLVKLNHYIDFCIKSSYISNKEITLYMTSDLKQTYALPVHIGLCPHGNSAHWFVSSW